MYVGVFCVWHTLSRQDLQKLTCASPEAERPFVKNQSL